MQNIIVRYQLFSDLPLNFVIMSRSTKTATQFLGPYSHTALFKVLTCRNHHSYFLNVWQRLLLVIAAANIIAQLFTLCFSGQ